MSNKVQITHLNNVEWQFTKKERIFKPYDKK